MEGEKKRKRADDHRVHVANGGGADRRREGCSATQPSEEEVDEFFTILRRMNSAFQYFEKGSNSSTTAAGNDSNGDGRKPTASEDPGVGADGVKIGRESKKDVTVGLENGGGGGGSTGLDLNEVPAADT